MDEVARRSGAQSRLHAMTKIRINGSGESISTVLRRENAQRWVMDNVIVGTPWKPREWIRRFGHFQPGPLPPEGWNPAIIKNYYFPSIDTTLTVNVLKGEIDTYKFGKRALP
jgi:hypothetical protein